MPLELLQEAQIRPKQLWLAVETWQSSLTRASFSPLLVSFYILISPDVVFRFSCALPAEIEGFYLQFRFMYLPLHSSYTGQQSPGFKISPWRTTGCSLRSFLRLFITTHMQRIDQAVIKLVNKRYNENFLSSIP